MTFLNVLQALPMWLINGTLFLMYWLSGHIAELLSLVFGLAIAFLFDPPIQRRATGQPRRYERGTVQTAAPTATYFTLVVLGLWLSSHRSPNTPSRSSEQPCGLSGW